VHIVGFSSNPSNTVCRQKYLRVKIIFMTLLIPMLGRDSSVSIAAGAGRSGDQMSVARFSESALEPAKPRVQQEPRLLPGGKAAGAWRWPRTCI
jgi:hypothetical protein